MHWESKILNAAFVISAVKAQAIGDLSLSLEEGATLTLVFKTQPWREFLAFLRRHHCHLGIVGALYPVATMLAERYGRENLLRLKFILNSSN